jgi:DNA-binding HxlR family transcriptional regulator
VPNTSYPQFCALARAAEVIGERWTLLIVRELLLGPKRFSDLRLRLDSISPSVLSERLAGMESAGLVRRRFLEPPAASTVYELTEDGRALEPAVFELIRWGARYLFPRRTGERMEPEWLRLVLQAYARRGRVPARAFELRIRGGDQEAVMRVAGTRAGTTVTEGGAPADLVITSADPQIVLGLMSGSLSAADALRQGAIQTQGDQSLLSDFSRMFETRQKEGG